MSIRCPQCGEEYPLNQIPQERQTVHCSYCGQEFSIGGTPRAEEPAQPRDAVKELAQQYFADIPDEVAEEYSAPVPEPVKKEEKAWSYDDDISEEVKRQQREYLLEFAQKTAPRVEEPRPVPEEYTVNHPKAKHIIREKRWQGVAYRILLLCVVIIPLDRIILGRMTASIEQFNWMQLQLVPFLLYFIAALFLPFPLLRRTAAPRLGPAVLLLLPLILDCWYLVPALARLLPPNTFLTVGNIVKIAVLVFALTLCRKPLKHPALQYKKEEINIHEPTERTAG